MSDPRPANRRADSCLERCEDGALLTLVFVLNGNSFNAAKPNSLTSNAASVLKQAGDQVIQLSNPRINSPAALTALENQVKRLAHGQTVGLVGFSAGGALALHVAATPGLKVSAVLDYYGVPDVRAYLNRHTGTNNPIAGLAPFKAPLVAALSGPVATTAHPPARTTPRRTGRTLIAGTLADRAGGAKPRGASGRIAGSASSHRLRRRRFAAKTRAMKAGGIFLALALLVGAGVGVHYGEGSLGIVIGLGLGIVAVIVFGLVERRRRR